ncbi:MAG: MBL fold metallo-hydrolase [Myxococcales bacterium]|nr:MBL fold metallo-hydrolase [Myxococcales bacterium]
MRRLASISEGVTLRWFGVSSFELSHAGRVLLLDPFPSRPAAARPEMPPGLRRPEHADAILVTHGHWDHYGDVPALAERLGAAVYLPADLHARQSLLLRLRGRNEEEARWRPWSRSTRVEIGGLVVESYAVHREERERSWVRRLAEQGLRARLTPGSLLEAVRVVAFHPWADAVALHVTHAATGSSIFFLGGLTRQVRGLPDPPPAVDVLALPLTQHSDWWLDDAVGLVLLLRPRVVLVHHHDDWLPPLTRPADVEAFRRTVEERAGVPVFEPQLGVPFSLDDLLAVAKRNSGRPDAPGRRATRV